MNGARQRAGVPGIGIRFASSTNAGIKVDGPNLLKGSAGNWSAGLTVYLLADPPANTTRSLPFAFSDNATQPQSYFGFNVDISLAASSGRWSVTDGAAGSYASGVLDGKPHVFCAVFGGSPTGPSLYVDGVLRNTAGNDIGVYASTGQDIWIGGYSSGSWAASDYSVYGVFAFNESHTIDQVARVSASFWQQYEPERIWVPVSVAGSGAAALAGAGVLAIAGHAPNVDQSANQAVEPSAGALAITGHVPAVAQSSASSVEPNSGTLTLTGYAPTVGQAVAVAPGAGAMTVTGHVPSVLIGSYVSADAGMVALAGYAPSVAQSANQALQPASGAVTITGYAPSVAQASPNYFGAPEAGTISITGHEPTVTQSGQGGGALARPAKRRIVLGDRVYEVAPRDVPALLEAHLLQRKPPRTVERVGEAGDQAQQVDKPVAQAATPAPVVDAAAALQARADAMLAELRRQAAADVERALLRVAQRQIEQLIDEEEAATLLLMH